MVRKHELRREKSGLWGFRPGPTQIRLHSLRKWLEALNFVFRKERGLYYPCSENKGADQLRGSDLRLCFAYAKIRFSHVAAHVRWVSDLV